MEPLVDSHQFKQESPCLLILMHGSIISLEPIETPEFQMTRFNFASTGLPAWLYGDHTKSFIDNYSYYFEHNIFKTCGDFFLYIDYVFKIVTGLSLEMEQPIQEKLILNGEKERAREHEKKHDDSRRFYPVQKIWPTNMYNMECNETSYYDKCFKYDVQPEFEVKEGVASLNFDEYAFGRGIYLLNDFSRFKAKTNIIQTEEFHIFILEKYGVEYMRLEDSFAPVWFSDKSDDYAMYLNYIKLSDIIEFLKQRDDKLDYLSWIDFSCSSCINKTLSSRAVREIHKKTNKSKLGLSKGVTLQQPTKRKKKGGKKTYKRCTRRNKKWKKRI